MSHHQYYHSSPLILIFTITIIHYTYVHYTYIAIHHYTNLAITRSAPPQLPLHVRCHLRQQHFLGRQEPWPCEGEGAEMSRHLRRMGGRYDQMSFTYDIPRFI